MFITSFGYVIGLTSPPYMTIQVGRGSIMSPLIWGGDVPPTTLLYPHTPLPPTYPPSPSYCFGGQKGGIMLLRKRATKNTKKNFWKNFGEKRELLFITVGYIYL